MVTRGITLGFGMLSWRIGKRKMVFLSYNTLKRILSYDLFDYCIGSVVDWYSRHLSDYEEVGE